MSSDNTTTIDGLPSASTPLAGSEEVPIWQSGATKKVPVSAIGGGSGTVTAVSVSSANGFAGSSSGGTTPALTLSTTASGVLKGNGTAISAAVSGTDIKTVNGTSLLGSGDVGVGVTSITASTTPVNGLSLSGGAITGTGTIGITGSLSGVGVSNLSGITGTPSGTTYLRGDGTWATPSGGSGTITGVTTTGSAINGLSLTGGGTSGSVNVALTGTLNLSSPPAIGWATPNTVDSTTLTVRAETIFPAVTNPASNIGHVRMLDGGDGYDYLNISSDDGEGTYLPVVFPTGINVAGATGFSGQVSATGFFSSSPLVGTTAGYIRLTDANNIGSWTIRSPVSLATTLTLTLPTGYPASTQFLQSDTSGNLSWSAAQKTITSGTAAPSGGSDGDIYLQYV